MISSDSSSVPLSGLVLAGGKSVRMGQDKGAIQWHGREQKYYVADLLRPFCNDVFISCRKEQSNFINDDYKVLADDHPGSGPIVAILTALKISADTAWLVVACDLPLLDTSTLKYLVEQRDPEKIATTFESPFDTLPEPLITIWEPHSLPVLLAHVNEGFTCPRKALIKNRNDVKIITPPDPDAIMNTNTPEDAEKVRVLLGTRK